MSSVNAQTKNQTTGSTSNKTKCEKSKKQLERQHAARAAAVALSRLSREANDLRESVFEKTGELISVNQALIFIYQKDSGCKDFRTFLQWKEAGYRVKKDEKAYRVWGQPVKRGGADQIPDEAPEGTISEDELQGRKLWPMCCLFNESQVELSAHNDLAPDEPTTEQSPALQLPSGKAEKLRDLAEKLDAKISACFVDRLENTPKRRKQAEQKRNEGYLLQRTQKGLSALADLHEQNAVPAPLLEVKSTVQMMALMRSKMTMVENGFHCFGREVGEPASDSAAALAAWALLSPLSSEEKKQRELKEKEGSLLFANIPGYFPTPRDVVHRMLDLARLNDGESVIEPSAGSGHILDVLRERAQVLVSAYETNYSLSEILQLKGYPVKQVDFLQVVPAPFYDCVLMNPPFEQLQDVDHVRHAWQFLKPGGRLVAVMSPSGFFRQDKKAVAFRDWFATLGGISEDLPSGAFKESGTSTNAKLIFIRKA